ncbi:hypothetical protein B0H10DRAFT_1949979 [Mycena sp. CBHHK59/15]|nr:hypothetical protein B0H10DRAFT_1949979 [Mycena sp. CBHHK59/15]
MAPSRPSARSAWTHVVLCWAGLIIDAAIRLLAAGPAGRRKKSTDLLLHDNIESAVYVLLKVLTQTFVPPVNQQHKWVATLDRYCWDDPDVKPLILSDLRSFMWIGRNRKDSTVDTTVQIFRSAGHVTRAQLVLSLLSLPLPDQRDLIDSSDYDAILLSLQGLVEQAVAAVRSVDASSLIWSSAKVVDAGQEEI